MANKHQRWHAAQTACETDANDNAVYLSHRGLRAYDPQGQRWQLRTGVHPMSGEALACALGPLEWYEGDVASEERATGRDHPLGGRVQWMVCAAGLTVNGQPQKEVSVGLRVHKDMTNEHILRHAGVGANTAAHAHLVGPIRVRTNPSGAAGTCVVGLSWRGTAGAGLPTTVGLRCRAAVGPDSRMISLFAEKEMPQGWPEGGVEERDERLSAITEAAVADTRSVTIAIPWGLHPIEGYWSLRVRGLAQAVDWCRNGV